MTILAIALGFAAINVFQGYVHSTYKGLTNAAIRGEGLGHLTIFKKGYLEQGKLHPEKYQFNRSEVDTLSALIQRLPDVALVTPRLSLSGLISNGKNSTIFISQGLVPADDALIRGDLTQYTSFTGQYLSDKEPVGVVLGTELSRMLNLEQGNDAIILSNTYSGMANALDVKVMGIYNTRSAATNDKMLLMTYGRAQELVDFHGAERLVVLLKNNGEGAAAAAARIQKAVRDAAGFEVEIKTWQELSAFYNQVKGMFDMIFSFVFSIVLVIVVMSVVNTMSMSVMERTREIGTMRALGLKRYGVKILFSAEGLLIGLLGIIGGLIIFFTVYTIIGVVNPTYTPPNFTRPVPLQVDLVWAALGRTAGFMVLLSTLAALVPARKSARMAIIDALGHV
jgi:putative ABC transport system permease protein